MTIMFIGGGNMATALVGGLVAQGTAVTDLYVVEPVAAQRDRLAQRFPGLRAITAIDVTAAGAELIVLAVKPQQMRDAVRPLVPHLVPPGPVVLSIAAGLRLHDLSRWLGGYVRLVRAMPNTPALIGKGIAGVCALPQVDAAGRALATRVLAAGGEVLWVDDEAMLDAVTGVSGSGPAYVFYFLEALEAAARDLGFDAPDARRLAYATFAGAVGLAEGSDADPAALRAQVTSRGGTTERALTALEAQRVKASIILAVKAAAARAGELGDVFGKDA